VTKSREMGHEISGVISDDDVSALR